MSRVQLASLGPGVLLDPSGRPLNGARGTIYLHTTTTPVTIWSAEVGGVAIVQGTFTTDMFGRIPGWVDTANGTIDILVPPADAVAVSLAGVPVTSLPAVNLREGSAVNGTWDAAFATAMTAAQASRGGRLIIPYNPAGSYVFANPLPNLAGLQIEADDQAVLDFSSVAANSQLIQFAGSADTSVALTSDANAGDIVINATVPNLAAGDLVKVGSLGTVDQGRSGMKLGEIGRVLSVGSGVFVLRSPLLKGPYHTSDSAFAQRLLPARGNWRGGRILGGGVGSGHQGVLLDYTLSSRVDTACENCEKVGLEVRDSWKARAILSVKGSNYAKLGYGAFITAASAYTDVSGNFEDCRHALTSGSPTSRSGCPLYVDFHNFAVFDSSGTGDAVDTHSGGDFIAIHDGSINDAGRSGVNIECANAKVHHLVITNPATYGIMAVNYSNFETSHEISAIEVIGAPQYAVRTSAPPTTTAGSLCRRISVEDVIATRCQGGVLAQSKNSYKLSNVLIDRVTSIQQTGQFAVFVDGVDLLRMPDVSVVGAPGNSTPIRVQNTTMPHIGGGFIDFVAQSPTLATTLTADLHPGDTTAQLASVTGLAARGSVTVESEPLSYTGVTGNTIQKLRRTATALLQADTLAGATTLVVDAIPSSWPSSGQVLLDSETVPYSSITGATLNLSQATVSDHFANTVVTAQITHTSGAAVTANNNIGVRVSTTGNGDIDRFVIRNAVTPVSLDNDCFDLELAKPHAVACLNPVALGSGSGVRLRRGVYTSQRTFSGPVSTMDRLNVAATIGTLASGQVYGALATCDDGGTALQHLRFATGSTTPSGITDCRVGVWTSDGTTKLSESVNLSATVTAASTEYEVALGTPLTPYDGQTYILAITFFGTTPPTVRGYAGIAMVNSLDPVFTRYTTGWTGGPLPASLGSSGTGQTPWLELFP